MLYEVVERKKKREMSLFYSVFFSKAVFIRESNVLLGLKKCVCSRVDIEG